MLADNVESVPDTGENPVTLSQWIKSRWSREDEHCYGQENSDQECSTAAPDKEDADDRIYDGEHGEHNQLQVDGFFRHLD